jgi:hypothetical protein
MVVIKDRNRMAVNVPAVSNLIGSAHGDCFGVFGWIRGMEFTLNRTLNKFTDIVPV